MFVQIILKVVYGCSLTTSQKPEAAATSVTENSETKPSSPPVIQMPSGPKTKYVMVHDGFLFTGMRLIHG